MAQAYVELGRIKAAREMASRAAESDREHVQARVHLGLICILEGDYDTAESALKDALWLDGDDPDIHQLLAALYMEMGEIALARRHVLLYEELMAEER